MLGIRKEKKRTFRCAHADKLDSEYIKIIHLFQKKKKKKTFTRADANESCAVIHNVSRSVGRKSPAAAQHPPLSYKYEKSAL